VADEDKEIFGKLDALMRRHAVAPPGSGSDTGGVPLLTELVEVPPVPAPAAASAGDDLAGRVLAEVEARLAAELERRMADRLAPQLKEAVHAAVLDMRGELSRLVDEALAQAIERRHVK
jgi:hypothetical protein